MIISRTPFRVSFFGGGTDYPEWYSEHGGAVLSTTIDKYCYISLRELPPFFDHKFRVVYSIVENVRDIAEIQHPAVRGVLGWAGISKGLEIHHDGDLPARAGLGSSSAFTVGLINAVHALEGRYVSKEKLASEAIHVEHCVMNERVGLQDQIATAFGGFNHIALAPDGSFSVQPMVLPQSRLKALQDHLLLVFTGISRLAPEIAAQFAGQLKQKQRDMAAVAQMVKAATDILSSPTTDLAEFGRLLGDGWSLKRSIAASVSNATVDGIYDAAMRAGAIGGKLLGAGGGGFMLLFVRPGDRGRVQEALRGLITVPFAFDTAGSRIALYQPDGL